MKNNESRLIELADACVNGACNVSGILISLGRAIDQSPPGEQWRNSEAVKVIIGQVSYLLGESLGPSSEALQAYTEQRKKEGVVLCLIEEGGK